MSNRLVPIDPDDTGEPDDLVPATGVDAGPVTQAVTTTVDRFTDRVPAGIDTARGIAIAAPARAAAVGISAGRVAIAVGRHVGDRTLAGIPGPDDAAQSASAWATARIAAVTRGGFLANGWGRFRRHRFPCEH